MQFSENFIAGFASAVSALGQEGDYRHADWSAPYKFLQEQLAKMEPERPKKILGFKIVVSNAIANDIIEFHHADGRVDRLKIGR
jgi:hypothetical protein